MIINASSPDAWNIYAALDDRLLVHPDIGLPSRAHILQLEWLGLDIRTYMSSNVFRTFLFAELMRGEDLYLESRRGCCQETFFSKNVKLEKKRVS